MLQAVRALMIVGIVLGAIGCLIAIFALKSLKMGNMEDNAKATMTLTSGVMFLLAGEVMSFAEVLVKFLHAGESFLDTTLQKANLAGSGFVSS